MWTDWTGLDWTELRSGAGCLVCGVWVGEGSDYLVCMDGWARWYGWMDEMDEMVWCGVVWIYEWVFSALFFSLPFRKVQRRVKRKKKKKNRRSPRWTDK